MINLLLFIEAKHSICVLPALQFGSNVVVIQTLEDNILKNVFLAIMCTIAPLFVQCLDGRVVTKAAFLNKE